MRTLFEWVRLHLPSSRGARGRRNSTPVDGSLALVAATIVLTLGLPSAAMSQGRPLGPLRPELIVAADTDAGELNFERAAWATRLRDGGIAVADRSAGLIRVFGSSGQPMRVVGGKGQGPGEFSQPGWVSSCGTDSIFVWDVSTAKFSVFGPSLEFVRSWILAEARAASSVSCSRAGLFALRGGAAPNRQHDVIQRLRTRSGAPYELWPLEGTVILADGSGSIRARSPKLTLGTIFAGPVFPEGRMGTFSVPMGAEIYAVAIDSTLVLANPETRSLTLLVPRAPDLAQNVPTGLARVPPSTTSYERAVREAGLKVAGSTREYFSKFALDMQPPRTQPAFTDAVSDPLGLIWVRVPSPRDDETRLVAIDLNGASRRELLLDRRVTLVEVGVGHIIGIAETRDGDQSVVMWRFQR